MTTKLRLDDVYRMTAHIYSEQNAHRPASATFAHFVEVCGILTMHARSKRREEVSFEDALCKALGWYFPLMAKFKVQSVEELIYRKYPYTCPYCRETPHVDSRCKIVHGTTHTVNHTALRQKYVENKRLRPQGISDWQRMFDEIYPRGPEKSARSIVALFEEIGELSEAVRVFDRFPKYFIGEAADVFSYLMALANEYNSQRIQNDLGPLDLESEFLRRYPGLCVQCGYQVCICPSVPESTVGRMAKELDVDDIDDLFASDFQAVRDESIRISGKVLQRVGGYSGLIGGYPFDRGEANHTLVLFCLELADRIDDEGVASRLRSAALKAGAVSANAGTRQRPGVLEEILRPIQDVVDNNKSKIALALGVDGDTLPNSVGSLIINEVVHGDKYVTGEILSYGPGAQIGSSRFAEKWREIEADANMEQLSEEIRSLRLKLEQQQSAENAAAIQQLSSAEKAATEGDGSRVLRALYAAGKTVQDLATQVGSGLVVEVIKKANGL